MEVFQSQAVGGFHFSEANNMGQASPDRRVILRGLGFGWEEGELILSRSFVGPSSSPTLPLGYALALVTWGEL